MEMKFIAHYNTLSTIGTNERKSSWPKG